VTIIQHYKQTRKTNDILTSFLSVLPDIFVVIREMVPLKSVKEFCLNMHNTEESINRMYRISNKLGEAWRIHRNQDLLTHDFTYEKVNSKTQVRETRKIPKDSVFLLSGGLDSFIIWRLLDQPMAVYFAIGHKAQNKEIEKIKLIGDYFDGTIVIDNSLNIGYCEMKNGYIPYRNLFFIMLASYYSPNIALAQILEYAPDKNKRFYHKTEKLLKEITTGKFQQLSSQKIKIWTPFDKYTKTELVRMYCDRFNKEDLTKFTTSCYDDKEKNCGRCTACFSRYVAMMNNNIKEEYETIPSSVLFKQRWSIKDFKLNHLRMYIKRWLEMRPFFKGGI
jgi:7-cyano-7-deazaguanine synthase in queuosine biosynthesis